MQQLICLCGEGKSLQQSSNMSCHSPSKVWQVQQNQPESPCNAKMRELSYTPYLIIEKQTNFTHCSIIQPLCCDGGKNRHLKKETAIGKDAVLLTENVEAAGSQEPVLRQCQKSSTNDCDFRSFAHSSTM